jgi:GGDEF domain-containing protein
MQYQAYHDALTGLANRRLFSEYLALALALAPR